MSNKKKNQKQEWHYSRFEDEMTTSPAWERLTGNACKVFIEFYRWGRDGRTFYKLYTDVGYAPATYKKIIKELVQLGFIDIVEQGGITRHEVDADGVTCWNRTYYRLSGRWKKIK